MTISIKTQGQNLTMYQGSTFEKTFTAKDSNSSNVTISTGTCASQMRKNHTTTNSSFILTFTTALSGSNVTISATATQTSNMPEGLYVYDVEYTQSDGITRERVVQGMVTVLPEATKS